VASSAALQLLYGLGSNLLKLQSDRSVLQTRILSWGFWRVACTSVAWYRHASGHSFQPGNSASGEDDIAHRRLPLAEFLGGDVAHFPGRIFESCIERRTHAQRAATGD
jgi:hypothetical protein